MSRTPIGYGTHRSGKHHPVHARTGVTRVTPAARRYISGKIRYLRDEGVPQQRAVAQAYSYARREGYKVPLQGNLVEHHSPTVVSKHIVDIAHGKASPKTVAEARAVILYMDELRAERLKKELETRKALLAYERGTGTTHHIKEAFKHLPTTSRSASIEAERKARRKIGLAIQKGLRFRF